MQANRIGSVPIEVADERPIPWVPEGERVLSDASTQRVGDIETLLGGTVDRNGVASVPVEVPCDRNVAGAAEVVLLVSGSLSVRVSQVKPSGGPAVHRRCGLSVAVPVTHERFVARVPEVHAVHSRAGVGTRVQREPGPGVGEGDRVAFGSDARVSCSRGLRVDDRQNAHEADQGNGEGCCPPNARWQVKLVQEW